MALSAQNAEGSLCDWVFSGTLERFPDLKIAYAESQVGWMPYLLERMDIVWQDGVGGVDDLAERAELLRAAVASSAASSTTSTASTAATRSASSTILFETDYPHADGTWPHSREVAHRLCQTAGMDAEEYAFLRGNAIAAFGLERFGITR